MTLQHYFYFFLSCLCLNIPIASSQIYQGPYRSADNPLYWKNRTTVPGYWQQDVHYDIDAELTDETDIISAKMTLIYYNNSPFDLDKLYFRLYQNAFIKGSYLHQLQQAKGMKTVFGPYEEKGLGTVIEQMEIDGYAFDTLLNNTILKVQLKNGQKILSGDSVVIRMSFTTYFDQGSQGRRMKKFTHQGHHHYNGVLWYPRMCVYDHKFTWHTDQHLGKEFYGDYGSYRVNLTLPSDYIVEATGKLQNRSEVLPDTLLDQINIERYNQPKNTPLYRFTIPRDGKKTWTFAAVNVHDFAFTADPSYRIGRTFYGEVECIALAMEENAHLWQPTAQFVKEIVRIYSEDFGTYEYPKMVAADARDGMEYPMITLNGGPWPEHQYVISHEIGHNWFYGMLGSNETYRAFLDEGFTQFLTTWSLKKFRNQTQLPNTLDAEKLYQPYLLDAMNGSTTTINTHSDDFLDNMGYRQVYFKGGTMLSNLQYVLGDSLFLNAMKHYVDKWKCKHPYPEDFRQSIIEYTQTDLNSFFDQWLETYKVIDYAVLKPRYNKQQKGYSLRFKRKGDMVMPLDIAVETRSGKQLLYHIPISDFIKITDTLSTRVLPAWQGNGLLNKRYSASIFPGEKIRSVTIDPHQVLADVNRLNNSTRPIVRWYVDQGKQPPIRFNEYPIGVRPDIWWNPVDGIKAGVSFRQAYVNQKHVMNTAIWYNTGMLQSSDVVGKQSITDVSTLFSYSLDYHTRINKNVLFHYHSRILDGISADRFSLSWTTGKNTFTFDIRSLGSYVNDHRFFIQTPLVFEPDYRHAFSGKNHSTNVKWNRIYSLLGGKGAFELRSRTPSVFSDFAYFRWQFEARQQHHIAGSTLRLSAFISSIQAFQTDPANIPLESQLLLGSANFEDMLEHKWTRTGGWMNSSLFWPGTTTGNLRAVGGLHIRGYAGYLAPATNPQTGEIQYLFAGNSGASASAEWDFDDYLPTSLAPFKKYLSSDFYIFSDAGWLTSAQTSELFGGRHPSPFRMNAGLGSRFHLHTWGKRNALRPLTFRVDFPLFLNRPPASEAFLAFRWQIGLEIPLNNLR
jgi:aminopeptidase N